MAKALLLNVTIILALLLSACSARTSETTAPATTPEPQATTTPVSLSPTETSSPTHTPAPTDTPPPTNTAVPTATDEPTATLEPPAPVTETAHVTATGTEPSKEPIPTATTPPTNQVPTVHAPMGQAVELVRIEDTDPGPPIVIQVSAVRIKGNGNVQVTGWVRNDGTQVYGGIGVIATFFTELECGETRVQNQGRKGQPGSGTVEYGCAPNWHGPVEVYATCSLLAPDAECPFSFEIYAREYEAYHLHPKGAPVEYHQPASLTLSGLNVYHDHFGYVHITGTATNGNAFAVRDAYISGMLIDAGGHIASVGMTLSPGNIAAGAGVTFDLRIEQAPHVRYEVQAQATQN